MAALLSTEGLDITCLNNKNQNVVHIAADWGHKDLIELFLDVFSKEEPLSGLITRKDSSGCTPCYNALRGGFDEIARLFPKEALREAKESLMLKNMMLHFPITFSGFKAAEPRANLYGKMLVENWDAFALHDFKPGFWADHKAALIERFNALMPTWGNIKELKAVMILRAIAQRVDVDLWLDDEYQVRPLMLAAELGA